MISNVIRTGDIDIMKTIASAAFSIASILLLQGCFDRDSSPVETDETDPAIYVPTADDSSHPTDTFEVELHPDGSITHEGMVVSIETLIKKIRSTDRGPGFGVLITGSPEVKVRDAVSLQEALADAFSDDLNVWFKTTDNEPEDGG